MVTVPGLLIFPETCPREGILSKDCDSPKDGYNPSYVDHDRDGEHPADGD